MMSTGSMFFAGGTYGNWSGTNHDSGNSRDFAGVMLSSCGNELWRWSVRFQEPEEAYTG